jgi:hypothetical protein
VTLILKREQKGGEMTKGDEKRYVEGLEFRKYLFNTT